MAAVPVVRRVVVGHLPEGGSGYGHQEWSEDELDAIVGEFFVSAPGQELGDTRDHRDIAHTLLWFASGYAPCDPYRWSPVSVEIAMLDRFPRKVVAPKSYMRKMPKVLKAMIRFAHAHKGIPESLTVETLARSTSSPPSTGTWCPTPCRDERNRSNRRVSVDKPRVQDTAQRCRGS